jgi:hypothetical protein
MKHKSINFHFKFPHLSHCNLILIIFYAKKDKKAFKNEYKIQTRGFSDFFISNILILVLNAPARYYLSLDIQILFTS